VTRAAAVDACRLLARGLPPGDLDARTARLMERIAASPQADVLRDALVEHGARALLLGLKA
jgi:hypothetical protein